MQGQVSLMAFVGTLPTGRIARNPTKHEALMLAADCVCRVHEVNMSDFLSARRKRNLVEARSNFYGIARGQIGATLEVIAAFVNRNHATVISGLRSHENLMIYSTYKTRWVLSLSEFLSAATVANVKVLSPKTVEINYDAVYDALLDITAKYSLIDKNTLYRCCKYGNGHEKETQMYAGIIRLVASEVFNSHKKAALTIGCGYSSVPSSVKTTRQRIAFDASIRQDYNYIKKALCDRLA